jgi:hypothetical protein
MAPKRSGQVVRIEP